LSFGEEAWKREIREGGIEEAGYRDTRVRSVGSREGHGHVVVVEQEIAEDVAVGARS
jgi:hypothetical protein